MVCPLCSEQKYMTLSQMDTAVLAERWRLNFGFDPFAGKFTGKTIDRRQCVDCALIYHSPEFLGDADFYAQLSRHDWYYEAEKWEFHRAMELIKAVRPATLLELGCGAGEFLRKAATAVNYSLGVDINPDALEVARKKGLNVRQEDIEKLQEKFDMIVMFEVLEHLQSPSQILQALADALNPGGVLVVSVPNPDGYLKHLDLALLDMPPHHHTAWKKDTFEYCAQKLGLEIVRYETESLRYVHYRGLLSSLIHRETKNKYLRKAQQLIALLLAPVLFVSGGNKIVGQTHLVAFKKKL